MLIPPKPGSSQHTQLTEYSSKLSGEIASWSNHPFWEGQSTSTAIEDLQRKRKWRIPADTVSTLRDTVTAFLGTHNFHNFTVGQNYADKSNLRYMLSIQVDIALHKDPHHWSLTKYQLSDPVIIGDTEWMSLSIHGQSFMLHQIRKMMSALILCCRTGTPKTVIDEVSMLH